MIKLLVDLLIKYGQSIDVINLSSVNKLLIA